MLAIELTRRLATLAITNCTALTNMLPYPRNIAMHRTIIFLLTFTHLSVNSPIFTLLMLICLVNSILYI